MPTIYMPINWEKTNSNNYKENFTIAIFYSDSISIKEIIIPKKHIGENISKIITVNEEMIKSVRLSEGIWSLNPSYQIFYNVNKNKLNHLLNFKEIEAQIEKLKMKKYSVVRLMKNFISNRIDKKAG